MACTTAESCTPFLELHFWHANATNWLQPDAPYTVSSLIKLVHMISQM